MVNLTGECVAYILNYIRDNPNFVRYYRYTDAPDEMFIQTIVLNSSFAKRTVHYEDISQAHRNRGSC